MVKDREVEIMEKLYEAFLDNWEKHAPDFLLFLWGSGIFKLPAGGNEPFGHGVSKKPDERQGIFHRAFYCAGLLPYRFPKKGENWIALGNQNELRVESLEKEFGAIQLSVYRIPNGQDR